MGTLLRRARPWRLQMSKSELTALTVKILLGLLVAEWALNWIFELCGKHHSTPVWLCTAITTALALILRATFKEKK